MTAPADLDGLVLPAPAGTTVDLLRAATAADRRPRLRAALDFRGATPAERRCLDATAAALDALSGTALVAALDQPLAAFDAPFAGAYDRLPDPREPLVRALGVARHVVGAVDGVALVLPPRAFAAGPVALPHVGVLLDGLGGPVAVAGDGAVVELTWDDGRSATLPASGEPPPGVERVPGLWPFDVPHGVPLLDAVPEVAAATTSFGPASGAARRRVAAATADAVALLRDVWPEAADQAERLLAAVVPLWAPAGTRSHSTPDLAGAVLTSAAEAVSAADLLCHELAHTRIWLFLERDPLLAGDQAACHPSPWRVDPRPLLGVLLGVHAFLDVCHLYRRLAERGLAGDVAEAIYARQSANVRTGLDLLERVAEPTPFGAEVLTALAKEVAAL